MGDSFTVMTFGSRTGDFAQVTGANLGGGLYFQKVYTDHSLTLVVAQPQANPGMGLLLLD